MNALYVEQVTENHTNSLLTYLRLYEQECLFLLSNYVTHGYRLTSAINSGNYKLIKCGDQVVGVFCLFRRGNLIIHSQVEEKFFPLILASCQQENLKLTGLIGMWTLCQPLWNFLKNKQVICQETFASKEILYQLTLPTELSLPSLQTRALTNYDFSQWINLRVDYMRTLNVSSSINKEQLKSEFLQKVKEHITWGAFLDNQLVTIADFNAKAFDLAQVGGVYTDPAYRGRGFAKMIIQRLIFDAKTVHQLRKLIIFTNEHNLPARSVYEKLGAKKWGHYALFFGL